MDTAYISKLRKFVAPEFIFGADASMLAGQFAANLSVSKALVVTDPHLRSLDLSDKILDSLKSEGITCVIFSDVSANPREDEVMAGAALFNKEGCDALIAIGGGSPMDCAKAIGIVCTNKRHVLEFEGVDKVDRPGPPLICIPTTAGSAADVSQFCIITALDRKAKIAIVSKSVLPDVALIDPVLTMSMDRNLTAYTGLDALTHATEAYVSNASSAITDLNALESVRMTKAHLVTAVNEPDNLLARSGMMLASTYAGLAFSNAILGAVHAMAHSLGGLLDLPHGLCNAILLEHVIRCNYSSAPEKYRHLGIALGADIPQGLPPDATCEKIIGAYKDFKQSVGVQSTLCDLGVTQSDFPLLAEHAMADACMLTNPKELSVQEITEIFKNAC